MPSISRKMAFLHTESQDENAGSSILAAKRIDMKASESLYVVAPPQVQLGSSDHAQRVVQLMQRE